MSDRELLELAAKAAGYKIQGDVDYMIAQPDHRKGGYVIRNKRGGDSCWNPITDDGDALRLAVKLEMNVLLFSGDVRAKKGWNDGNAVFHIEDIFHSDDLYAATRRAIVRAAAEIGKGQA